MKKSSVLLLASALLLTGCGASNSTGNPTTSEKTTQQTSDYAAEKTAAKAEVSGYVDLANYSETNKTAIQALQTTANNAIDAATSEAQINAAVVAYKTAVDEIQTLAQELEAYKTSKITEVEGYADLTLYSEMGKTAIAALLQTAKTAIAAATSISLVDEAVTTYKAAVDLVPTLEEERLIITRRSAIAEIENYIQDLTLYSDAGKAEINRIIADATENINEASTEEIIESIVEDAKADLDDVLTIAEEEEAATRDFFKDFVVTEGPAENFSVSGSKVIADTKTPGVGTYAHIGNQSENTYAVFDTYITCHYNSTYWDSVTLYFRTYDKNSTYKIELKDDKASLYRVTWDTSIGGPVSELYMVSDRGFQDNVEYHVQIMSRGWTKSVLVDGECWFTISESHYTVGRTAIGTWEAGYELRSPKYMEYATEAEFDETIYGSLIWEDCVNKSEAEKLTEAKAAAKEEISANTPELTPYSEANALVIIGLVEKANSDIDSATSIADVETIVATFKSDVAKVPTAEQEAAASELAEAKTTAIAEITNYKDVSIYSTANKAKISEIITTATEDINSAFSAETINSIVSSVKEALDALKTNTEEMANLQEELGLVYSNNTKLTNDGRNLISDSKSGGTWTQMNFGTQSCGNKIIKFKLTPHFNAMSGPSITFRFNAWNSECGYELSLTGENYTNDTELEVEMYARGWNKKIYINNEVVLDKCEGNDCAGFTYIESWESGYEIKDLEFYEYDSPEAYDASELGGRIW